MPACLPSAAVAAGMGACMQQPCHPHASFFANCMLCGPSFSLPVQGRNLLCQRHAPRCLPVLELSPDPRSLLQKRKGAARDAHRLTLRCLASFEDANAQDLAGVKGVAAAAVTEFIRSPDVFQFDLLESPAVAQLKGDAQYGKLWQLLQIVLDGDLKVTGWQLPVLGLWDRHYIHMGSSKTEVLWGRKRSLLWDIGQAVFWQKHVASRQHPGHLSLFTSGFMAARCWCNRRGRCPCEGAPCCALCWHR